MAFPAEVKEQAVARYLEGGSASELAREYGTTRQTILRWVREIQPGASRPVPASLRGQGEQEDFWRAWDARQRERAAAAAAEDVAAEEQEEEQAREPAPAPAPALSAAGRTRLTLLPWLLLATGGAAIGKGLARIRGA